LRRRVNAQGGKETDGYALGLHGFVPDSFAILRKVRFDVKVCDAVRPGSGGTSFRSSIATGSARVEDQDEHSRPNGSASEIRLTPR